MPASQLKSELPIKIEDILQAKQRLKGVAKHTPLEYNEGLSQKYNCKVWLKREDLQYGRSYKIRGAGNYMRAKGAKELAKGVVAASAGNHAQGVAINCVDLNIPGVIFMPKTTPEQKVKKVRHYGKKLVEVRLIGDTFDDAYAASMAYCQKEGLTFVHPFNNQLIIEGQGTIGAEIIEDCPEHIDYVFCAVGGGGMSSGVASYVKHISPETKIVGVEPKGAPSLSKALEAGKPVQLDDIDKFVDGASVGKVGELTFAILQKLMHKVVLVPEGMACTTILDMYNEDAIVVEPAGALPVSALELMKDEIEGKSVVCIIGGSNNDIDRMAEIKERSLIYEGLLHYFMFYLPSRPGSLAEFLPKVLTKEIDIVKFHHEKKSNKETGATLMGLNLPNKEEYPKLLARLKKYDIQYTEISGDPDLYYYFL